MPATPVLLVDENLTFLRIASRLLRDYYAEELDLVGASAGGDDVLNQLHRLQPRVVLLGLGQYNLSGLRLIPQLRAVQPALHVIVLGSLDIGAYQQAALKAGADAFIAKAGLNHTLLPTIARVLKQAAAGNPAASTSPPAPTSTSLHANG